MAHWLALKLGVITLEQARHLQGLKLSNPDEYVRQEKALGATRAQLEQRFGKDVIELVDRFPSNFRFPPVSAWKTNRKTGKRFRR